MVVFDREISEEDKQRIAKMREDIKSGKVKIVQASDDKIQELEVYVERVLVALGHPEALVTDKSMISDFLFCEDLFNDEEEINDEEDNDNSSEYSERVDLAMVSDMLGFEVREDEYVWEVAKRLKDKEEAEEISKSKKTKKTKKK